MHHPQRNIQAGFTYIGVLVLVAVMGTALAAAGQVWHTVQRQEKERELLFVGHQFRLALARYARNTPRNAQAAPLRLEELLRDPRFPDSRRYLRRIYLDPITGTSEWGLITAANGEIYGVHSRSSAQPLKQSNFARSDRQFDGMKKYSDWVFMLPRG